MLFLAAALNVVAIGVVACLAYVFDLRRHRRAQEKIAVAMKALLRERERLVLQTADLLALRRSNERLLERHAHTQRTLEGLARGIDGGGLTELSVVSRALRKILRGHGDPS